MERIETLVLPREPKSPTVPKLNPDGATWTAAARLGRYLISGMGEQEIDDLTLELLRRVSRTGGEEVTPDPGSIPAKFAERAKTSVRFLRTEDNTWYAACMKPFPKKDYGLHIWLRVRDHSQTVAICAFDVPTAVGALAVTHDMSIVESVISRNGYREHVIRDEFFRLAARRWEVESNLALNRRYKASHSATVFEDKTVCDKAHRKAAENSLLSRRFDHVELDDSVDLGEFRRLDGEIARLFDQGWLPPVGGDNAIRFRLCGRHRAIGVYDPTRKAIAIDPRAPRSGAHELAHAYDFEHGQLSVQPAFQPILEAQKEALKGMGLTPNRLAYYSTPTEVFARAYELHLLDTGRASSMTSANVDALCHADGSVRPLVARLPMIDDYFHTLGL